MNLAAALLLSFSLSACAGRSTFTEERCGIVGCLPPVVETQLDLVRGGIEWDNRRGVELEAKVGPSDAATRQRASVILTWDGSRMSPRPEALRDDPKLKYGRDGGSSRVWTDPDLSISLTPVVGTQTGTLTIVDQGKTTVLHCTTEGTLVRCDP
jgi:hypothetical protein